MQVVLFRIQNSRPLKVKHENWFSVRDTYIHTYTYVIFMIKLILSYLPVGLTLALIPNYPQNNPRKLPQKG